VFLSINTINCFSVDVDVDISYDNDHDIKAYNPLTNTYNLDLIDADELYAQKLNENAIFVNESHAPTTDLHLLASSAEFDAAGGCDGASFVNRAAEWVSAKLHYCQAANGGHDLDKTCARTCNRQHNPAWDRYRSDCSGLISWAWGLPPPGVTTALMSSAASTIQGSQLRAGDAVNRAGHHVMLFSHWITPNRVAMFLEEPGCAGSTPFARNTQATVTIRGSSVNVGGKGTFTAVRKRGC